MSEVFQPGFGARLKAGREEKSLAVADVAAKLKLTSRQVEALEAEDLSHLPSEVFVRGFVRNYARLVDVDVDSLIAPVDVQAAVAETITAPSAGVTIASNGLRRWVVFPLIGLGLFLLLVATLYHWLRQGEDTLVVADPVAASQPLPATPAPPPAAVPSQSQTLQLSPRPEMVPDGTPLAPRPAAQLPGTPDSAPAAPPVAPAKPAVTPPAVSPPPGVPAPAEAPAPVVDKSMPAKPAGAHSLRFEPGLDAWIQVVDGNGNRFSKLVRAGTAESFSGEPPFRLVVGEAARVRMSYDGHVIDLTPFIGQKVARLTLE